MYRHFAAVTLVVTALMAVFSSGEQREAEAKVASDRQAEQAAQLAASEPRYGKPKMLVKVPAAAPGWSDTGYSDNNAGYGEPMDKRGAQLQDGGGDYAELGAPDSPIDIRKQAASIKPSDPLGGIASTDLAKMTPAQREAILKKLQKQKQLRTPGEEAEDNDELNKELLAGAGTGGRLDQPPALARPGHMP